MTYTWMRRPRLRQFIVAAAVVLVVAWLFGRKVKVFNMSDKFERPGKELYHLLVSLTRTPGNTKPKDTRMHTTDIPWFSFLDDFKRAWSGMPLQKGLRKHLGMSFWERKDCAGGWVARWQMQLAPKTKLPWQTKGTGNALRLVAKRQGRV